MGPRTGTCLTRSSRLGSSMTPHPRVRFQNCYDNGAPVRGGNAGSKPFVCCPNSAGNSYQTLGLIRFLVQGEMQEKPQLGRRISPPAQGPIGAKEVAPRRARLRSKVSAIVFRK